MKHALVWMFWAPCVGIAPCLAQSEVWSITGDHPSDNLGVSTGAIGDVNGDGIPDVLVGATGDNGVGPNSGSIGVRSGADGSEIWTTTGGHNSENFGASVARIADLDGDGIEDIVAGGHASNPAIQADGRVRFLSGATGATIRTVDGTTPGEFLGFSVATIHDWNGDGTPDVLVGAPSTNSILVQSGFLNPNGPRSRAIVLSGADGSVLHEWLDTNAGTALGWSVAAVGDTNGDGTPEVAVGAPGDATTQGRLFLYSGADGSELWSLASFDRIGRSVSGTDDINGDGVPDVVYGESQGGGTGRVRVVSGVNGSLIRSLPNTTGIGKLGYSVDATRDLDGDGVADIIAGGPAVQDSSSPKGFLVYSGANGDVLASVTFPPQMGLDGLTHAGWSVRALEDVTGDGLCDFAIGEPYYSGVPLLFGRLTVYSIAPAPGLNVTVSCAPANPHFAGGPVDLSTSAMTPSGDLHLEALGGPPGEFGFFLVGGTAAGASPVFGGVLCLDTQVARFNGNIATNQGLPQLDSTGQFDASGVLQNLAGTSRTGTGFDVPPELPFSPGRLVQPGESWSYQLWYRDQVGPFPNPGSSANVSNAVTVTFP